ncbi:hypothetical protein BN2476_500086 [Paraburkholderia piptadeniae]|uniref:Uncharacterized protein n=1 Tax=Paraburkholderia piptadeniae TaxID=1701573 RepID=A0A1N7SFL9_9BURK|nr:hypothetical protein BN2476_500086 [Paraburkholderia piptadeniae]
MRPPNALFKGLIFAEIALENLQRLPIYRSAGRRRVDVTGTAFIHFVRRGTTGTLSPDCLAAQRRERS